MRLFIGKHLYLSYPLKLLFSNRFFEFEEPTKSKLTRKKEAILTGTQWQIDIDENLLPDERMLLERDFSIEIPRQPTPPQPAQSPVCIFLLQVKIQFQFSLKDNLPPLPWEVSKPTHGKRITLLPDIEVRDNYEELLKREILVGTNAEIRYH